MAAARALEKPRVRPGRQVPAPCAVHLIRRVFLILLSLSLALCFFALPLPPFPAAFLWAASCWSYSVVRKRGCSGCSIMPPLWQPFCVGLCHLFRPCVRSAGVEGVVGASKTQQGRRLYGKELLSSLCSSSKPLARLSGAARINHDAGPWRLECVHPCGAGAGGPGLGARYGRRLSAAEPHGAPTRMLDLDMSSIRLTAITQLSHTDERGRQHELLLRLAPDHPRTAPICSVSLPEPLELIWAPSTTLSDVYSLFVLHIARYQVRDRPPTSISPRGGMAHEAHLCLGLVGHSSGALQHSTSTGAAPARPTV